MPARSHRDLEVWRLSMQLVLDIYRLAASLPKHEMFGLASQLRRSCISVPANIAEGYGRLHRGDYLRHLSIAQGSLRELQTLLEITFRLDYVSRDVMVTPVKRADRVGRMMHGLIASLRAPRVPERRTPAPGPHS